jgi:hypothetical protein
VPENKREHAADTGIEVVHKCNKRMRKLTLRTAVWVSCLAKSVFPLVEAFLDKSLREFVDAPFSVLAIEELRFSDVF